MGIVNVVVTHYGDLLRTLSTDCDREGGSPNMVAWNLVTRNMVAWNLVNPNMAGRNLDILEHGYYEVTWNPVTDMVVFNIDDRNNSQAWLEPDYSKNLEFGIVSPGGEALAKFLGKARFGH